MWLGVIHYVVNQHKWILPHRLGTKSPCIHGPLTEERETGRLEIGSVARVVFRYVFRDSRLIRKTPYHLNCRYRNINLFSKFILRSETEENIYNPKFVSLLTCYFIFTGVQLH